MAQSQGLVVSDLLPSHLTNIDEAVKEAMAEDQDIARGKVPSFVGGVIAKRTSEAIRGALDLDVFRVLAAAWAKAQELHEYADPGKHPSGEVSTLFLGEHNLTCELHPVIEIGVGAIGKMTLRFDLTLTANIRAVELTLQNARIVQLGRCEGQVGGALSYRGARLHQPLKSRALTLLSSWDLPAPGLAIA
jgi:hypothetical protein